MGVNAYVVYMKTKKVMMVSSRDFVCNYINNVEPDGTIIDCQTSNRCFINYPSQLNTVRADVFINGTIVTPTNGGKHTKLVCLSEVDLKGIPDWILRTALKD